MSISGPPESDRRPVGRRPAVILVSVAALTLATLIGLSYRQWRNYRAANAATVQGRQILESADSLLTDLLDAETGQRGYLLTGEDRYLEPYNNAVRAVPADLAKLSALLPKQDGADTSIQRLSGLIDQKLGELQRTIDLRRTQGSRPALDLVLSDGGERSMDAIRALSSEIRTREYSRLTEASDVGESGAQLALLLTAGGALILLFFFAAGIQGLLAEQPRAKVRSTVLTYSAAVVATVAATLLRAALTPLVGESGVPFITYFPAVLFVAWYGGIWPASLCILLSGLAGDYYFLAPLHSMLLPNIGDQVTLLLFVLIGLGIALLGDSQRRALYRAKTETEHRREAETTEREHRQRLQTTLGSIGDAVMATDAGGRITFVNRITLGLLRQHEEDILGKHLDDVFRIVNEYTRAPVESPVAKVFREGTVVGMANHTVLVCPDGREIPIDDSAAPIHDTDGTLRGTVLVFRDITARRQAEQTRLLLAAIVDSSEDAIMSKDLQGIVTSWNTGAERMFGYSASEMIGRPVSTIAAPDREDEMPAILERVKNGEHIEHYETLRRTKAGGQINISLTVSPVRDTIGRIVGASKVARDITDRKRAEERLRRSQEETRVARDWLQTTLASIGDGVIATDTAGQVTFLNPVAASLTGWTEEDAIGKRLDDVFIITNEGTGDAVENPVSKALREGRVVGLANHTQLTAKDGRRTPIDDSAAPIRDREGRVTGVVLVFRDVTERKRAEDAVQESLTQLRRAAQEVQAANHALLRANDDLKQFAFAASHDLQEPLRMITSYSQLLLTNYQGQLDGEPGICVNFISRGTKRMRELLADLLAYTQLTGEDPARDELVDLNAVLQKALENLGAAIAESNAAIQTSRLPLVYGHSAHFLQLFQNLIGNAIKYHGDKVPEVNVASAKEGRNWRVSVADNGIGIAPEYHDRIFGVFKRLHGKRIPGTGIGLAICQRVVERYGGRIWVESEPNNGATFHFTVPVAENEEAAHAG